MSNDKPTTPPARLVEFRCNASYQLPPPLHAVTKVECDAPGPLLGWGVHIRGATLFLESPPGWKQGRDSGKHMEHWDKRGPRRIIGPIPLASVTLTWEGATFEACERTVQRYDLPEMVPARHPAVDSGPAIPPSQMGDP